MVKPEEFGHLHLVYHSTVPLKHNANTLYAFISNIMPLIKKEFPNFFLLYYFSDGAPS